MTMTNLQTTTQKNRAADDVVQPAREVSTITAAATSAVAGLLDLDEEAFTNAEAACAAATTLETNGDKPTENVPETVTGDGADDNRRNAADSLDARPARLASPSSLLSFRSTDAAYREAEKNAAICREFIRLTSQEHHSLRTAAAELGMSPSNFSGPDSMLAKFERGGRKASALLPQIRELATDKFPLPDWFVPAAKFFYLLSNTRRMGGSVSEAVRRTISLPNLPFGWTNGHKARFLKAIGADGPTGTVPTCPAELRERILAREKAGQPLTPHRISKKISVNRSVVQMFRSPRDWSLDTLSAPGSQRRYFNMESGQREIMQPGDWFGGDDSTPGIAVCVPCSEVITPCSQKFGVLLGRFQWLAYNDGRTDKILAHDYVVRPRGSYRAEDILNGMGAVVKTSGIPRKGWQFEGGTFHAKLVQQAIKLMGCEHWRTYSPHQKAIESVFNRVWTRLAVQFPHADMGRYRGENEKNCQLYEACKKGQKDPRTFFPMLADVVRVFEEEVAAHNAKKIFSEQYGQWEPGQFFDEYTAANKLREFSREMEWIFSPVAVERKIRQMMVRCRVPMFEDFSVPYEFNAPWMPMHNGKLVRIHFNPRQPKCTAKVVLLENSGERKAGEILGDAQLIGETTGHIRLMMGWADDDQRAGYVARQRTKNFMRRETRGIGANGRVTYAKSEEQGGIAGLTKIEKVSPQSRGDAEKNQNEAPIPAPRRLGGEVVSDDEIAELERRTKDIFI